MVDQKMPDDKVGYKVKKARIRQGLSVRGLAQATGVSPSTISKVENSKLYPRLEIWRKISRVLHENVSDLYLCSQMEKIVVSQITDDNHIENLLNEPDEVIEEISGNLYAMRPSSQDGLNARDFTLLLSTIKGIIASFEDEAAKK